MRYLKSTTKSQHIKAKTKKNNSKNPADNVRGMRSLLTLALCVLILAMLLQPQRSIAAAAQALQLWWNVITPSLLPFFVISKLLIEIGAAEAAGRCFAPLMRPLFRLPGSAALAVVLGFCSGFPTGAAITAELRKQKLLNAQEGARLLAFTNNAGPLYISAAVATGLLHCPAAATLLALSHYGVNLLLGILLGRLSGAKQPQAKLDYPQKQDKAAKTPLNMGQVLRTAGSQALDSILLIGCYMCFFAIIAALSELLLTKAAPLMRAAFSGLWEMSLGMNALVQSGQPLQIILPLVAAQLGFGGFSVQAQVLAMVAETDIKPHLYLLCRPLQAAISALLTALLLPHLAIDVSTATDSITALTVWSRSIAAALIVLILWLSAGLLLRCRSRQKYRRNNS